MNALPVALRARPSGRGATRAAEAGSPRAAAARRALRHGLVLAGLLFAAYLFAFVAPVVRTFGYDAFAYWSVDQASPYTRSAEVALGGLGSFLYPPIAALAAAPFAALPWWVFLTLWTSLLIGTLIWLGGRQALALLAFPPVAVELYHGNVHILLAAAIVLGFRHPWTWSFVLLTKVTPGVGLLWFLVRREWRPLLIALGVTAALAGVSFIAAPGIWFDWVRALAANSSVTTTVSVPLPIWVRLPAGALLVVWGARTDRAWTVPVGSMIALPVLWFAGFAMLAALPALLGLPRRPQPSSASAASTT